jgi:hypothetical protein
MRGAGAAQDFLIRFVFFERHPIVRDAAAYTPVRGRDKAGNQSSSSLPIRFCE